MPAHTDTSLPPRYRNARLIARGGMGEVYRATDDELGREVAVKLLAARYSEDDALRERFRREALAAARLSSNPNIVTIFDVEEHEGRPLIVMELMPGGSLEKRVEGRSPCAPSQALDWLDEAANALDAAHAAGIVHRDVKPGNLLLDDRNHVKVADFGIASAAGLDSFTQTGTIMGTAGYLSPEQARGERATPASDRYSLAVVAWELLAGRRPFESETPTAEAAAHAHADIPSIHSMNPELPAAYDEVFRRALAKDPGRRPATAAELVGDLRRALHTDAGDTWVETAAVPTRVAPTARRSGTRWWIPVLLVLLVAGGALAAYLATRGGGQTSSTAARTIVHTVTARGTTVQRTVTAPAPAPATTPTTTAAPSTTTAPTTTAAPSSSSGATLNNEGYAKMNAGDYAGALPLLEQAVSSLQGTGSITEAYADYNLAYTRYALGQCTDVLSLLDSSERIQGRRTQIDQLRKRAQKTCG